MAPRLLWAATGPRSFAARRSASLAARIGCLFACVIMLTLPGSVIMANSSGDFEAARPILSILFYAGLATALFLTAIGWYVLKVRLRATYPEAYENRLRIPNPTLLSLNPARPIPWTSVSLAAATPKIVGETSPGAGDEHFLLIAGVRKRVVFEMAFGPDDVARGADSRLLRSVVEERIAAAKQQGAAQGGS